MPPLEAVTMIVAAFFLAIIAPNHINNHPTLYTLYATRTRTYICINYLYSIHQYTNYYVSKVFCYPAQESA